MADEAGGVDGGGLGREFFAVGAEARKPEPVAAAVKQIEGRRGGAVGGRVREADAAVAGDYRRYALADFRRHVRVGQEHAVVVRVRIDEAGCGDHARCVDFGVGGCLVQRADFDYAVAAHADPAVKARRARAVDDGRVANYQVVVFSAGHNIFSK